MVNAAIVGLGWWGRTLVNSVQGKSDVIRFVAAHTRTRAKVEDFCREKQLVFEDRLETILRDPKIDAVVYAAQHLDRSEQVQRTAAAGKHVFVEKPFALTLRAADAALAAAKRAGVVLGVGYQRRFPPGVAELRARVKDGRLGTIVGATGEGKTTCARLLNRSYDVRQGRVLVDGVDELVSERREEARQWLCRLVNAYPEARYAITTRPAAVPEDWMEECGFAAFDLLPLSDKGVRDFVEAWHTAARDEPGLTRDARTWLAECEARLVVTLARRPDLRRPHHRTPRGVRRKASFPSQDGTSANHPRLQRVRGWKGPFFAHKWGKLYVCVRAK